MQAIDTVVKLLEESRSLLFITGAGVSADSGLPTYRGIGGLYTVHGTQNGLPIEEVLSGWTMRRRPELTWKYLGQIEQACRGARHNRAHEVMAEMERCFDRIWVLTQNVDGFHRQAGSRNVIDIHGDLHRLSCPRCGFHQEVADYSVLAIPPRCPGCAGHLRPDVVLFGETLPLEKVALLEQEMAQGFDLTFSIGTTSIFPYIAGPVHQAKRQGKPTVEINPGTTEVSHLGDIRLAMGAALALEQIWSRYRLRRVAWKAVCRVNMTEGRAPCVYCGTELATTMDHVVARSLFTRPLPSNMATVLARDACNTPGWPGKVALDAADFNPLAGPLLDQRERYADRREYSGSNNQLARLRSGR